MNDFLTKEEELELGTLIQKGLKSEEVLKKIESGEKAPVAISKISELQEDVRRGNEAAETLVENNQRLVYDIANKFKKKYPAGPHIDDIVGDGMVGLWVAVKKYDPTRGYKFSTMAFNWINQSITRGSNKTSRLVRLPENRISDFIHISRVRREIESGSEKPSDIDLAIREKLNLTEVEYRNIMNAAANHTSINSTVVSDYNGSELVNYIDNHTPSAEESLMKDSSRNLLYSEIDKLDSLEKEVLFSSCKLSFDGSKPKTAKLVKEENSLTATQYKKIFEGAIGKIRSKIEVNGFEYGDY